nr:MAG TPA: hypothetical protein [Caudoviricetes sp.]
MLIVLTGNELQEVVTKYLEDVFQSEIKSLSVAAGELTVMVELGKNQTQAVSVPLPKEEEETAPKPKRKRRTKAEMEEDAEEADAEVEVEPSTHYSELPAISEENRDKYTKVLELLNTNVRGSKDQEIEDLVSTLDADTVLWVSNNKAYQLWLSNRVQTKAEEEVPIPELPTDDVAEPLKEELHALGKLQEDPSASLIAEVAKEDVVEEPKPRTSNMLFG